MAPDSSARNRYDLLALSQDPCQRQLRWFHAFLRRNFTRPSNKVEISPEVFALETRIIAPPVIGRQIFDGLVSSGQESPPQRTVGHKADSQFVTNAQDFVLRVSTPQ